MKNVKYVGHSDFREVSGADFEGLGVSGEEDLRFATGEVKELKNEVADALLENATFTGEFEERTDADIKAEEEAAEAEAKARAEAEAQHVEGQGDTGSGDSVTGAGGSTSRGPAKKAASTTGTGSST